MKHLAILAALLLTACAATIDTLEGLHAEVEGYVACVSQATTRDAANRCRLASEVVAWLIAEGWLDPDAPADAVAMLEAAQIALNFFDYIAGDRSNRAGAMVYVAEDGRVHVLGRAADDARRQVNHDLASRRWKP